MAAPDGWVPTNAELLDNFEPLSEEQLAKVGELSAKLADLAGPEQLPATYLKQLKARRTLLLMKFLMARNWDLEKAEGMLRASAAFRLRYAFDTTPQFPTELCVRGFDMEALADFQGVGRRERGQTEMYADQLQTCVENSWHKWDKRGRPIIYERIGRINPTELLARAHATIAPGHSPSDGSLDLHLHSNEVGNVIMQYLNSTYPADRQVSQVIAVFDCTDLGMKHLWDPLVQLLKRNSSTDKLYFPEGLHKAYVVNAPTIVTAFWAVVKLWLEPSQIKKVSFHKPHETKAALLEVIDEEHLPAFLGGTCNCPGGCVAPPTEAAAVPLPVDATRELTIPHRAKKVVEADWLQVEGPRKVGWQVHVREHNVHLQIRFRRAGAPSTDAAGKTTEEGWKDLGKTAQASGEVDTDGPGVFEFEFGNEYSRLRAKHVYFRAYYPGDPAHLCGGVRHMEMRETDPYNPKVADGITATA
jgi:hypothetical protein